jgi:hypothetical protein
MISLAWRGRSDEGLLRGVQHKVGDVMKHATKGYVRTSSDSADDQPQIR